jgi:gamma-glutamylcyclotransferase (GGCT)/AIG2-like uncharacterized protein YtfP
MFNNFIEYKYIGPSAQQIRAKYIKHPRYYFAYGSNLNKQQMLVRCPTAKFISAAELTGFKLVFRGVLDIEHAHANSKVSGVIFKVKSRDIYNLDQYEGYPTFYTKETVIVKIKNKNVKLFYYLMVNQGDVKPPSQYYYDACAEGYKDWDLDVRRLRQCRHNSRQEQNTKVVDCGAKWNIKTRTKTINVPTTNARYNWEDEDLNQTSLFDDLKPYGFNDRGGNNDEI